METHLVANQKMRVRFSLGALRGGAVAARQAHNLEVDGSNPSPATSSGRGKVWPVSAEKQRVVRNHEIVGSNPNVLAQHFHKHSGVAKR